MNRRPVVYIVEDEKKMRDIFKINLSKMYDLELFPDAESAYTRIQQRKPDIIVADVKLPGIDGIEFMQKVKKKFSDIPFIIFTGYGTIEHAVETMKKGAFDYITKPIKIENMVQSIGRALSYAGVLKAETVKEGIVRVTIQNEGLEFITRDPETLKALAIVKKAAKSKLPILIVGETGTGKELVARYIHEESGRKGPFVKINCASIPRDILESELFGFKKGAFTGANRDYEGKIALSHGGTLFLDEIGEMPLDLQAKLLHIIELPEYYPIGSNEKKRIDLNIITATNRNLRVMVDRGEFRRDLFYRIAVIPIYIPPLRERKCDILPIAEYFLKMRKEKLFFTPGAKLKLLEYNWPGNVRELKNVIERSLLFASDNGAIEDLIFDGETFNYRENHDALSLKEANITDDIPDTWEEFKEYKSKMIKSKRDEITKIFIEKLLVKHSGNISASARDAGLDRRQLQDMIKELDIDVDIFKHP